MMKEARGCNMRTMRWMDFEENSEAFLKEADMHLINVVYLGFERGWYKDYSECPLSNTGTTVVAHWFDEPLREESDGGDMEDEESGGGDMESAVDAAEARPGEAAPAAAEGEGAPEGGSSSSSHSAGGGEATPAAHADLPGAGPKSGVSFIS